MLFKIPFRQIALGAIFVFIGMSSGCKSTKPSISEAALIQSSDLAEKSRAIIGETDRADRVAAQLSLLDELIEDFHESQSAHGKSMRVLLADYDSTSEALQEQLDAFNAQREQRRADLRKISDNIRSSTTPEEWDSLKKKIKKTLSSIMTLALQP